MSALFQAFRLIWAAHPWAMTRGAAAAFAVLLMGAALLGLSGWFITATGLAGLAGLGIAFDVFRPSAGVRFLALGRAGARYAERLLTHDATLKAIARLRVGLVADLERLPVPELRRVRGPLALTRITADVDALDGLVLRLVLPILAAALTLLVTGLGLAWLVTPGVALAVVGLYGLGGGAILAWGATGAYARSAEAETARQALRRDGIGMFRQQRDLVLTGRLAATAAALTETEAGMRRQEAALARLDRDTGALLSGVTLAAVGAALWLGSTAVAEGRIGAAEAAIGVFVALALAEGIQPLRRGLAELGRMRLAAERITAFHRPAPALATPAIAPDPQQGLTAQGLSVRRPGGGTAIVQGLDLRVPPGAFVALLGPSGSGKSTVLDTLAGVTAPAAGEIHVQGVPVADWSEPALRGVLGLVPQRTVLLGGTVRENLALAVPRFDAEAAEAVLELVALTPVLAPRGGLEARLGEGGLGLSGGEMRRLALARAVLRHPAILLLDEATEGVDPETARQILLRLRETLPGTAILASAHKTAEREIADQIVALDNYAAG